MTRQNYKPLGMFTGAIDAEGLSLLDGNGDADVEFRIYRDAFFHRGEEFPLLQSVEQDLVDARIGSRGR